MNILIFAGNKDVNIDFIKTYISEDMFIIACDGGLDIIHKLGLIPNIILGDMDSVDKNLLTVDKYINSKIIKFNEDKDFTDLDLVLLEVEKLDLEYENIYIFGATNGRADHYMANIFLLQKYIHINNLCLVDERNKIYVIDGDKRVEKSKKYLSLIPLTETVNVSLYGVKYPLKDYTVTKLETLMISNEIVSDYAQITVHNGVVLVIEADI